MNRLCSLAAVLAFTPTVLAEVKVLKSNNCSGAVAPITEMTSPFVGGKYQIDFTSAAAGDYYICSDPGDVVE